MKTLTPSEVQRILRSSFISHKKAERRANMRMLKLSLKARLTPAEKRELAKLKQAEKDRAEKTEQRIRIPRCTCRGMHYDPKCPLHRRIGPRPGQEGC